MVAVIARRSDGSLLGEDEKGNVFVGVERRVSRDQAKYTIKESKDGASVSITEHVGDHVVSHQALNRDGFIKDARGRILHEVLMAGKPQADAEKLADARAKELWNTAKNPQPAKVTHPVTGEEILYTVIDWKPLGGA